jgi:uncharacterized phage-like protein YoqJ
LKKNRCIISGEDVSFVPFGYNEDSLACQRIKQKLLTAVLEHMNDGVEEFYTDCSYGFPMWGAEIVLGQMMYHDIMLYVVFPYESQPYKYTENWQERFHKVHGLCTDVIPMFIDRDVDDNVIFIKDDEETLLKKAADYMLDDCSRLIFCGREKGSYIYEQAVKRGYDITVLTI